MEFKVGDVVRIETEPKGKRYIVYAVVDNQSRNDEPGYYLVNSRDDGDIHYTSADYLTPARRTKNTQINPRIMESVLNDDVVPYYLPISGCNRAMCKHDG